MLSSPSPNLFGGHWPPFEAAAAARELAPSRRAEAVAYFPFIVLKLSISFVALQPAFALCFFAARETAIYLDWINGVLFRHGSATAKNEARVTLKKTI